MRIAVVGCLLLMLLALPARADDELRAATGYRNGRPLKLQLVAVDYGIEVEIRTAQAFRVMQRAAFADGVELIVRSGFRTHEKQTWLYRAWRTGYGNRAARPGFSNHQSGRALDIMVQDPVTLGWLDRHARRFGFRRTVPNEPWHWELFGRPARGQR